MVKITYLRSQGLSQREIARRLGVGKGTVIRALAAMPQKPPSKPVV